MISARRSNLSGRANHTGGPTNTVRRRFSGLRAGLPESKPPRRSAAVKAARSALASTGRRPARRP